MQKIDETIVNYINENREKETIREDVYQQYGIILQDLDLDFSDDGLLVNKYPNIFTIKYQNSYVSSLVQLENYVLFDISSGLCYDDQLVKYNIQGLNGTQTTKTIQLYENLMVGKHFEPKIVKQDVNKQQTIKQENTKQGITQANYKDNQQKANMYFVVLQYSPSIFRVSLFPQKLSFILSPKLDKKLLRTDIKTINSLQQEYTDKYQYKSFQDTQDTQFVTPLSSILEQQIQVNQNDYLTQRQWYNIAKFMEKIEQDRRGNNTLESRTNNLSDEI